MLEKVIKILFILILAFSQKSLSQSKNNISHLENLPIANNVEFDDWRLFLQKLYIVNSQIKIDSSLQFESYNEHDLPFYTFKDKEGNHLDFILNSSDYKLPGSKQEYIVAYRSLKLIPDSTLEYQDMPIHANEILLIKKIK